MKSSFKSETHHSRRTHHGKVFGIPVYLDMTNEKCPHVEPKYCLGFALTIMEHIFGLYCLIKSYFDPYFEPLFPILVGDKIEDSQSGREL